jgi:ankyrin repeat protein
VNVLGRGEIMNEDTQGNSLDPSPPRDTSKRRWLKAGAALAALGLAGFGFGRLGAAVRPQRPIDANLIEAVKKGDTAAVRRLLDQGANPNSREVVLSKPDLAKGDPGGRPTLVDTALMIAVGEGHLQVVRLLLHRSADVNGGGVAGFTPLMESVRHRRADLAELLLKNGAKPNQLNDYGDTALLFAANEGETRVIDLLLRHGADINGGKGQTPLAMAVEIGWKDAVKLLIARGADVNRRRPGFRTPLEIALLQPDEEITALIREAGGKGRSLQTLRQENERQAKEWEAEHRAQARPESRDRSLTQEDGQVIETALLDLLAYEGPDLVFIPKGKPDIILFDQTPRGPGPFSDDQLNAELDVQQANDITLEMRRHLHQRNTEPTSIAGFKPTSKHILLRSEGQVSTRFNFHDKAPQAKAWVKAYLPGYSPSRDRAVLRFWLGPSPHGASGTYFLTKQDGMWRVKWREFAFYV